VTGENGLDREILTAKTSHGTEDQEDEDPRTHKENKKSYKKVSHTEPQLLDPPQTENTNDANSK
jgi:hypothetical protein